MIEFFQLPDNLVWHQNIVVGKRHDLNIVVTAFIQHFAVRQCAIRKFSMTMQNLIGIIIHPVRS